MLYRILALTLLTTTLSAGVERELLEMARLEQEYRMELIQREQELKGPDSQLRTTIQELDRVQAERLKEIIAEQGWPRKSRVGENAANAAWLIAQHASHDPAFQEEVLRLITPLVMSKEISAEHFALLADRIACHRGEPQLYGTQYRSQWAGGELVLEPTAPILDEARLDHRRNEIGLAPHEEYLDQLMNLMTGRS